MKEDVFRGQIKRTLEKTGGLVIRINDVPGTGIRYADLIWVYNGKVYGVECKVNRVDKPETLKNHSQGKYATAGQLIANNLFQRVGALYVYAIHFVQYKKTLIAYYEDYKDIYSAIEAKELKPKYIIDLDTFRSVAIECAKVSDTPLDYFRKKMSDIHRSELV